MLLYDSEKTGLISKLQGILTIVSFLGVWFFLFS